MKEELERVLAKSLECIDDADYLFDGDRYEAAVNRAYYAMLTAVMGLLLNKNIFVKTHSGVKSKFHELYIKTHLLPNELGEMFENAFSLRQEADYEFKREISKEDAEQTIEDSKKFFVTINDFLQKGN